VIRPLQRIRTFDHPFRIVWDSTEQVMRGKQALPALNDGEGGLFRFVLLDETSVTALLESVEPNRTKVYLSRNRGG